MLLWHFSLLRNGGTAGMRLARKHCTLTDPFTQLLPVMIPTYGIKMGKVGNSGGKYITTHSNTRTHLHTWNQWGLATIILTRGNRFYNLRPKTHIALLSGMWATRRLRKKNNEQLAMLWCNLVQELFVKEDSSFDGWVLCNNTLSGTFNSFR